MGITSDLAAVFMVSGVVVQLGYPPLRIDLLTSVTGVEFTECWANRVILDVGGVEAGFISLPDLIANKRAAGRPQDLVDADVLEGSGDG